MEDEIQQTNIGVPISVSGVELQQLDEFIPNVIEHFENIETDEADATAEQVRTVYENRVQPNLTTERITDRYHSEVSMAPSAWRTIVVRINQMDDLRADYLSRKLYRRLRDQLDEMEDW